MYPVDPWASKSSLKWFLAKFKEDQELDALIKDYVGDILGHKIVMSPSKGPYGEKGKDIVAIEDEMTGEYCSYVIKWGTLQKNLNGPSGILVQMREAMLIDLEIEKYRRKRRTVIVVHNGEEGYRGAIDRFEKEKKRIENEIDGALFLRPIDRWDIEEITNRLFPHGQYFRDSEVSRMLLDRLHTSDDIAIGFYNDALKIISSKSENNTEKIKQHYMEHFYKIKNVQQNYSFAQINKQEKNGK